MSNDPYDTGTPKYLTAQAIYDALCELTQAEEISILSEMFSDVSYDGQEYYYTDKGYTLKEKFEEISGYGNKMWVLDLAAWQIDKDDCEARGIEIHDIVYDALINSDLAKRIGFKKLFIEHMMRGVHHSHYDEIKEAFLLELGELNRFEYYEMIKAYYRAMQECNRELYDNPYPIFCHALCDKVANLHLEKETKLIAECRALLTSYDDFILGLRMNQALYEAQERQFKDKIAQLQSYYDEKVRLLYLIAERHGIVPAVMEDMRMIERGGENTEKDEKTDFQQEEFQ